MGRRTLRVPAVALTVDSKDGTHVLDFHSPRGTFATLLDGLDISLKAGQELMRHSDPRLTMNRYTRAKLMDLGAAVEQLPTVAPAPRQQAAEFRATGTDPAPILAVERSIARCTRWGCW
jgi:hypothetical protein